MDQTSGTETPTRRGLGMTVVMIGVLLAAIDGTIVVLALPEIQRDLGISLASVIWVPVGYLLVATVLTAQVGRLGDLFGRVRMYEIGFAIFTLASVLCALSWDAGTIIGFRLVQGVGAALVAANSGAIIAELYPPASARVPTASTRSRSPPARSSGCCWAGSSSRRSRGAGSSGSTCRSVSRRCCWPCKCSTTAGLGCERRLDPWGMVTLGAGLFGIAWPMSELAAGPLTPVEIGVLVAGIALLVVFVAIERRHPEPTVDLSLFRLPG